MKKKILFALAAIGMGMGLTTTATAGSCSYACNQANLHCNVTFNTALCNSWADACERCQGHSGI